MKKFSVWLFLLLHQKEVEKIQAYVRHEMNEYEMANTPSEQNSQRGKLVAIFHVMRLLGVPEE